MNLTQRVRDENVAILRKGVDAWNAWRRRESFRPNLWGADRPDLWGADLRGADLSAANLSEADLSHANLSHADLSGANLRGTRNLNEANLRGANLSGADLSGANLRGTRNLNEANLRGANLSGANLIDAYLDSADLTGAKLWETQRGGWSIKNVICRFAFWDREGKEPTEYEEGEFERIFAEKPRIKLRYAGGTRPIDLLALPLAVERLQADYPGSALQIHSVQNDAGGALVTITVEDRAGRDPKVVELEFVSIKTQLECVVGERDRLQRSLDSWVSEGISKLTEFLALPRQGDTFNIHGQVGAAGSGAQAHNNTFQQIQAGAGIDLPKLAEELGRLRNAMKGEATGTPEHDEAIGAVAGAEKAAAKGDGPAVLQYLKSAGEWTLGIAEKIGVGVAIEALKRAM